MYKMINKRENKEWKTEGKNMKERISMYRNKK